MFARSAASKWPKGEVMYTHVSGDKARISDLYALTFVKRPANNNVLNVSAEVQTGSSKIHYPSRMAHQQAALRGVRIPRDNKRSQVPVQPWPTL